MAKRAPSSQPRSRRTRVPAGDDPAQAADAAVASADPTMAEPSESTDEISAADTGPTEDDIRTRAYHRYLERGGHHGQDFDDWVEAERELRSRKSEV